jgi:hypothetical protein
MNCPTSAHKTFLATVPLCPQGTSSHAQTTYLRDCVLGSGGTILKQPLMGNRRDDSNKKKQSGDVAAQM